MYIKTLFINATDRDDSKTLILAKEVLKKTGGKIVERNLFELNIKPFNNEMVQNRFRLIKKGKCEDEIFDLAKEFRDAENIVIAAPV